MPTTDGEDDRSEEQKDKQNHRTDNSLYAAHPPGTFNACALRMDDIGITEIQ